MNDKLTEVSVMVSATEPKRFFFTDGHGRHRGRDLSELWGGDRVRWVTCTTRLPHLVRPRPGCEDGIVDTAEKYVFIYYKDHELITVEQALAEIGASTEFPEKAL